MTASVCSMDEADAVRHIFINITMSTLSTNAKNAINKLTLEEFTAVIAVGKMVKGQYDAPEFKDKPSMSDKYQVVYSQPDVVDAVVDRAAVYTGKRKLVAQLKRKVEKGQPVFWGGYSDDIKNEVLNA